jgi:GT2 family glycosyltransferase
MTFFSAFLQMLMWRPHRALAALYWYATGRRVRARNRLRMMSAQAPHAYRMWIDTVERQDATIAGMAGAMAGRPDRPSFTILLPIGGGELDPVEASIAAVRRQWLGDWQLLIVRVGDAALPLPPGDPRIIVSPDIARDESDALRIAIAEAQGDYIVPLRPGALLARTALSRYAEAAIAENAPTVMFGDQDECDRHQRRRSPWFKPQWNREMFLAQDYLSSACAIHTPSARGVDLPEPDLADAALFALLLRLSDLPAARIVHVAAIQCHLRHPAPDNQANRVRAVSRHLIDHGAIVTAGPFQSVRVQWPLPAVPPLVSIVVPTRDKETLLRACVTGVLSATRYRNFELIIVDNGSVEPDSLRYLGVIAQHPQVRVVSYDRPYNFSAINNFAAELARGEYLCLLNNDTEVLDENWLTELMRYAVKPHVGAVGAKLLYDDGTIQHAGVVVGMGGAAGHAHRFLRNDDPGYFRQAHIPQYVSAVTAACLVVARAKFLAVGGLDDQGLQIAFNDVDLCLKLDRAGWRNVYAPQAVMIHHESKSRGKDHSPKHIARYRRELGLLQERWGTRTHDDPLHHPNLDRSSETFVIRL